MKKNLLISIFALAAVLASCTKVDVDMPTQSSSPAKSEQKVEKKAETAEQEPVITFNATLYTQQTKTSSYSVDFPEGFRFRTFALYTGSSEWASNFSIGDAVKYIGLDGNDFEGEVVSKQNGIWKTTNSYCWPKGGNLSFASYAPADAGLVYNDNKSALFTASNYVVAKSNPTDLLIADMATDQTRNVTTYSTSGVPTLFKHALSQINFTAEAKEFESNGLKFEISLKSVVVNYVQDKADFSWNSLTNTASWTNKSYANEENTNITVFTGNTPITLNEKTHKSNSINAGTSIVLPQGLDEVTLTVKFNLTTLNASNDSSLSSEEITETVSLKTNAISNWEVGHSYSYKLILSPLSSEYITFDPALVSWTTVSSTVSM